MFCYSYGYSYKYLSNNYNSMSTLLFLYYVIKNECNSNVKP